MSLWINRRERNGQRRLYLVGVPIEIALVLIGIAIAMLIVVLRRF